MTNTQKLEGIKSAKMQKLKDLEEDNTFSFISIKSQHFLFQLPIYLLSKLLSVELS